MKKLLAGILALALSLGLMGCNNNDGGEKPEETTASVSETTAETTTTAPETTVAETTTVPETTVGTNVGNIVETTAIVSDTKKPDGLTKTVSDEFMEILTSMKYTMVCSTFEDGKIVNMTMSIDLKNGLMHMVGVSDGQAVTMLLNKEGMYMIDDSTKQYLAFPIGEESLMGDMDWTQVGGYEYVSSGKGELNGREYPYDEYKGTDGESAKIRIYVSNGKVIAMESIDGNESAVINVDSVSKTVDASVFKLPAGYSELKLDLGGLQ